MHQVNCRRFLSQLDSPYHVVGFVLVKQWAQAKRF